MTIAKMQDAVTFARLAESDRHWFPKRVRELYDVLVLPGVQRPRLVGSGIEMDDNDKEYIVRAEVPGFSADEIDVKVSGNVLTLAAEHKEESSEKNGSFSQYGSFHKSFTLPQGVLTDKTDADYRNGVLELHLPKSEECKPKRIAVKAK